MRVQRMLIGLGAVLAAGSCLGLTAVEAARSKVSVAKKALSPRSLGGGGGNVWVVVNVSRKGGGVSHVRAGTSVPGSGGGMATLTAAGKGRYQGYLPVPRNSNRYKVKANIVVTVTSPDGPEQRRIGVVTLGPGNDDYPPPPPSD